MNPTQSVEFRNFAVKISSRKLVTFNGILAPGDCLALMGPSGCGKTTFLKAIAGFSEVAGGELLIEGENIVNKAPHLKRVGLAFQGGALFAHLNVLENVIFGLRFQEFSKNWSPDLRRAEGLKFLKRVGLEGFENRKIETLSGGEKQRVSLIRTLIVDPKILLLDEPLSALDESRKKEIVAWMKLLLEEKRTPTILVTHDRFEAENLGNRVVEWNENQISF